jgi:hypothetical protein
MKLVIGVRSGSWPARAAAELLRSSWGSLALASEVDGV